MIDKAAKEIQRARLLQNQLTSHSQASGQRRSVEAFNGNRRKNSSSALGEVSARFDDSKKVIEEFFRKT